MVSVLIYEDLLLSLLEAARRKYPSEFFALLGGRKEEDLYIIDEVIYVPWREGENFAAFDVTNIPWGVLGSFHSHPGSPIPSPEDLRSFGWLGEVHLIAGYPYTPKNVRAYDVKGRRIPLKIGQRASF